MSRIIDGVLTWIAVIAIATAGPLAIFAMVQFLKWSHNITYYGLN